MRPVRVLLAPSLALLMLGCEAPTPASPHGPRSTVAPAANTGKRALYGDAGLVPTREGERIRRELALAGEIHAGLELLGLGPAHVDVELRGDSPSAVVVARVDPSAPLAELEAEVHELVVASVPGLQPSGVHVSLQASARPPAPTQTRPVWALALACLGLGLSLGVSIERLRARRR